MIVGTELADLLDDGLLVVSHDGEVRTANAAAAQLLSIDPRPSGVRLGALLRGLSADELARACAGARETRLRAVTAGGAALAVRVVPRADDAWVFLRREPEPAATSEQHDHLQTILRQAPLVLFTCDARGVLTMNVGHGLARLGHASGTDVGRSMFEAYPDAPWLLDAIRRALAGESLTAIGELRGVTFEVHYSPMRGPGGEVVGVLGVALDVTERERATRRLTEQQALLNYLMANIPQAIFWKDRQRRFLGCNQKFLDHTGVARVEDIIGKTDHDIWDSREEADFFRMMDERVMSTGVPIVDIEEPLLLPDGRQTWILTSKVPIRDDAGEVTGILGIYVDITERKRIELELQRAKDAADAALRARSEFITVMSHELRTPLTLILGPLESLLADASEPLSERARAELARMWRNASRLRRLVDDILDFQRLAAGQMTVTWEPVDVYDLVADIVLDAEPAARSAGITLRHELDPDLGTVPLDRRMFEKIVLNLLGNALKFTPAGGAVTVTLAREGAARMRLSVRDTGPGIAPAEHERVFQRFQQLDGSTSRKHEGTGLGLAIVREFTEAMGGAVGLRSEPGAGACFTVGLPIDADRPLVGGRRPERPPAPAPAAIREVPSPCPPSEDLPRLLVAEDNPDMRDYIATVLRGEFAVELAANGAEALRAALARRPDVVVSDIMMPEMDGYELVARLKQDPQLRDVPVVVLSAKASRDETVHGLESGADDYLPKPFAPAELLARVRAAHRLHCIHLEVAAQKRELEHALRELEDTQEQLVQSSKLAAVGTLVAGLSHELNNPVAVILMSAQLLLRRDALDPVVRRTLERIDRHAQRCAALVDTLLSYSRRRPEAAERCELAQLMTWLIDLVRPEAEQRKIGLLAEVAPEGLPTLLVNRSGLESALLNVVGNALDATGEGGTVTLRARAAARESTDGAEITVHDDGEGIPPDALPHVFEPFYTTKAPGKGTGLGLSMTHKFIRSHGGAIDLDSEPGRGTTVTIWLPLTPAAPTEATPQTP